MQGGGGHGKPINHQVRLVLSEEGSYHSANVFILGGLGQGDDAFLVLLVIESILARGPVQSQDEHALLHLRRSRRELHPSQTSFPFIFFLFLLFSVGAGFILLFFFFVVPSAWSLLLWGTWGFA